MKTTNGCLTRIVGLVIGILVGSVPSALQAQPLAWRQEKVDWGAGAGGRIKSIHYPTYDPHRLLTRRPMAYESSTTLPSDVDALADVNSPPIAGFVPWIAVVITDARKGELELDAVPQSGVSGNYLTSKPSTPYAVGIFDTGAAAHVLSAEGAAKVGLFDHLPSLVTQNATMISGATGEASMWVSKPLALFIDGLGAIDANSMELDPSGMVGETNVAINVGDFNDSPLVPTAIGSPLSVYFTAAIYNDRPVQIAWNGHTYSGPDVFFYENEDPSVPSLAFQIPLELRPADVFAVQYTPNLDIGNGDILDWLDMGFDNPGVPSIITNGLTSGQSLFFLSSVDLTHKGRSAIDKTKFILDTGAQVTVVSKAIAARLSLDTRHPEFEVEIQGVNGRSIMAPGFVIDLIELPSMPTWLTFRDVPVIVLDASSPEGGIFEGIIGMNLFTDFNLAFHGGGMFLQDPAALDVERILRFSPADIVPDGSVDGIDLLSLAQAWLSEPGQESWNPLADVGSLPSGYGRVDFLDFALLANTWRQAR